MPHARNNTALESSAPSNASISASTSSFPSICFESSRSAKRSAKLLTADPFASPMIVASVVVVVLDDSVVVVMAIVDSVICNSATGESVRLMSVGAGVLSASEIVGNEVLFISLLGAEDCLAKIEGESEGAGVSATGEGDGAVVSLASIGTGVSMSAIVGEDDGSGVSLSVGTEVLSTSAESDGAGDNVVLTVGGDEAGMTVTSSGSMTLTVSKSVRSMCHSGRDLADPAANKSSMFG